MAFHSPHFINWAVSPRRDALCSRLQGKVTDCRMPEVPYNVLALQVVKPRHEAVKDAARRLAMGARSSGTPTQTLGIFSD